MTSADLNSEQPASSVGFRRLRVVVLVLMPLHLVWTSIAIAVYGPFRDEAYVHFIIAVCFVAFLCAGRWLSTQLAADRTDRLQTQGFFYYFPIPVVVYLLAVLLFFSISATSVSLETRPQADSLDVALEFLYFDLFYELLAVVLIFYTFPVACVIMMPLWMRLKGIKVSLHREIDFMLLLLPVVFYLVGLPVFCDIGKWGFLDYTGPVSVWLWFKALPYFHPIAWLENPEWNFWLAPFYCLLAAWAFLNLSLVSRHLQRSSDCTPQQK